MGLSHVAILLFQLVIVLLRESGGELGQAAPPLPWCCCARHGGCDVGWNLLNEHPNKAGAWVNPRVNLLDGTGAGWSTGLIFRVAFFSRFALQNHEKVFCPHSVILEKIPPWIPACLFCISTHQTAPCSQHRPHMLPPRCLSFSCSPASPPAPAAYL